MIAKIRVTFDLELDDSKSKGNCLTTVKFLLPDYPNVVCPESIKERIVREISEICRAMVTAKKELFMEDAQ